MPSATRIVSAALISTALAGCALSGHAQGTKSAQLPDDISGAWRFETELLPGKGCRITGDIQFRASAGSPNQWTCEFVSTEYCQRSPANSFQVVKQTCTAKRVAGEIEIQSKVASVIDAGPPNLKDSLMSGTDYYPDNFTVTAKSAALLSGEFHSVRRAPVRFWRMEDLVS